MLTRNMVRTAQISAVEKQTVDLKAADLNQQHHNLTEFRGYDFYPTERKRQVGASCIFTTCFVQLLKTLVLFKF